MMFSLKIDLTVGRLLKRILEFTEKECDHMLIFALEFLGVLVEEEYQAMDKRQNPDRDLDTKDRILQSCIQNEDLFDTLFKILQKYGTKEKFNLVKDL